MWTYLFAPVTRTVYTDAVSEVASSIVVNFVNWTNVAWVEWDTVNYIVVVHFESLVRYSAIITAIVISGVSLAATIL